MRPVLLEMAGFGVFREPVTVDFTDAEFFALVGDTGAGKSTVLDAICFALYGNVPRYDDQRLVGAAMSLGANEAKVRLTFDAGGERYVAVRVVRRGAQNRVSTKEARLERVGDGAVLAGRDSELRAAVEGVVGLGFDDFTRCVVLPQGAFARFLHDKPADRQALLVRLLELGIYGRLVHRANARAAEHQRQLDRLTGQLSELPETSTEQIAEAAERADRLGVLGRLIDDAEPRITAAGLDHERAEQAAADAARLIALLDRVEVPADLAVQAERSAAAAERLAAADQELAAARLALDEHEQACAALAPIATLEHLVAVHERVVRGDTVVAAREAETTAARESAAAATAEQIAASARHEHDQRHLEEVRAAHRAHAIAVTLRPGEPCPVCEQTVAVLPFPSPPAALEQAVEAARRSEAEARTAAETGAAAERALSAAEAGWNSARERLTELREEVAAWPDPVELHAALASVRAAHARRDEAKDALRAAERRLDAARRDVSAVADAQRDVAARFHRCRDAIATLGPPAPADDLATAWVELAAWATARRPELEAERRRQTEGAEAARATMRELLAGLTEAVIRSDIDLSKPPTLPALRTAVVRAETEQARHLESLHRSVERRSELARAAAVADEARSVAHELARQLKTDRFQRWLVEATFHDLAERASHTLRRLSAGQFSLRVVASTGEFSVVDHLAVDEERSVRTLSGGETFQASLALALALSDHVMEVASDRSQLRLESIFLDEGFGTLDPATLDTVASTIETLGTDGRMVGIVTHVSELAERVPVRFRVSRGARGSTITRESS